jgi:multiple sugar transport system permease protein
MKKYKVIVYIILAMGSIFSLIPFWWLIRSSFMDTVDIFQFPPLFFPRTFLWRNYVDAMTSLPYLMYFKNTMTIMIPVMIGTLITSSMCAYGFARLKFPFRNFWFSMVIASMLLPSAVTIIPIFLMWRNLHLTGTFIPLTLPVWFGGGAFNIFLLRQFFMTIPKEIDEAAVIDGANFFQIFHKIMLALVKPALIAIGIFTFMGVWNDFFNPLIYLNDDKKFTIALGLLTYVGQFSTQWNLLMAASAVTIVPVILVFFIGQKYFIEGITLTGIKG